MENKLTKRILTGVTFVLITIGIIVMGIVMSNGDVPGPKEKKQLGIAAYNAEAAKIQGNPTKTLNEFEEEEYSKTMTAIDGAAGGMVNFSYYLTLIAIIVTIGFGIVLPLVKNPKSMKTFIVFIGALGVFLAIIYFVTKGGEMTMAESAALSSNPDATQGNYDLATWGLVSTAILTVGALVAWFGGAVYGLIKK